MLPLGVVAINLSKIFCVMNNFGNLLGFRLSEHLIVLSQTGC